MADFQEICESLRMVLSNDATIASLISTYENVPAVFNGIAPIEVTEPYINLFDIATLPDDTHSTKGEQATYQINVHALSFAACRDLMTAVNALLHYGFYTLDGYTLVSVQRIVGPQALPQDGDDRLVSQTADYLVTVQEN